MEFVTEHGAGFARLQRDDRLEVLYLRHGQEALKLALGVIGYRLPASCQ